MAGAKLLEKIDCQKLLQRADKNIKILQHRLSKVICSGSY